MVEDFSTDTSIFLLNHTKQFLVREFIILRKSYKFMLLDIPIGVIKTDGSVSQIIKINMCNLSLYMLVHSCF